MKDIHFKNDIYVYMIVAYVFSMAIRYIWVYQFGGTESFLWNDQLMINTNDGYIWATGVKDLASGAFIDNPRVPGVEYGLVYFTYFLSQILPFSLDTIILYMPAVIASLIVIPIILLADLYGKVLLGFFAALLASITWSFYNRTMVGYYDSDLFALVFPVFITYFLIRSTLKESLISTMVAALLILLYYYAYDASQTVVFGMGIGYIAYLLIFSRKSEQVYEQIILISIAMLNIDWQLRLLFLIIVFVVFYKNFLKEKKAQMGVALFFVLLFFYFGHVFDSIWYKIFSYMETGVDKSSTLEFFQVHQTIREAGKISFETFANRISGSTLSFGIAIIGYILLVIKRKEFLLFLPLIGIGFFAYIGGLRFTVYAVPAMAMGAVYFFYFFSQQVISEKKYQYMAVAVAILFLLYPNVNHVIGYKVPTVLNKQEVTDLEKLKKLSTPKDYTLAWWDYGYPIWYYSNTNTLIDGGKHNHDNYLISKIFLSSSPELVANLARVSVEGYVKNNSFNSKSIDNSFDAIADSIFKNKNPEDVLNEMEIKSYITPKKTRDIFLYLPYRMLNIFPTVNLFSNINLETGKKKIDNKFYPVRAIKQDKDMLFFQNNMKFDSKKGNIYFGKNIQKVKYFIITQNTNDNNIKIQSQYYHTDGTLVVIYMKSYGQFIVMDSEIFKSTYVQMFILGKYDKNLFELVVSSPYSKIYKIKK